MASTALTTTNGSKGRGVARFDMKRFDPKAAAARMDAFAGAVGGSVGGNKRFPGQKYTFSSGVWYMGAGKAKKPIKGEMTVVSPILQAAATWVKWENKKPTYLPQMYRLADGDELPLRETLGDLDQDEWDRDDKGNPQDPWRPVLIIPIRDEDGDTIDHIELSAKSAVIAGFGLFKEAMESMIGHEGEVPLVKLGANKAEMKRKVTVQRKVKGVMQDVEEEATYRWDVPVFEVVGWVDMKACDDPDGDAETDKDNDGDVGEVQTRERKAAPAPVATKSKTKAAEPIVKGKRKAKVVEGDDEDGL